MSYFHTTRRRIGFTVAALATIGLVSAATANPINLIPQTMTVDAAVLTLEPQSVRPGFTVQKVSYQIHASVGIGAVVPDLTHGDGRTTVVNVSYGAVDLVPATSADGDDAKIGDMVYERSVEPMTLAYSDVYHGSDPADSTYIALHAVEKAPTPSGIVVKEASWKLMALAEGGFGAKYWKRPHAQDDGDLSESLRALG